MGGHLGGAGGLVALALLCACSLPDSYHLGTSYGISEFDRPVNDFDTAAVYAGVSWHPGERARHDESLEATRRLEIATVTGRVQPRPQQPGKKDEPAESAEDLAKKYVPPPAKTYEEAWSYLIWAVGVLLLLTAVLIGVIAWKKYRSGTTPPKGDEA